MSIKEDIEDAVFGWLEQTTTLEPQRLIVEDQDVSQPPTPFLTVKVSAADQQIGHDETLREEADTEDEVRLKQRGDRAATVQVRAYGEGAMSQLVAAHAELHHPAIVNELNKHDVALTTTPGASAQDFSEVDHAQTELRMLREYEARWTQETEGRDVAAATEDNGGPIDARIEAEDPAHQDDLDEPID